MNPHNAIDRINEFLANDDATIKAPKGLKIGSLATDKISFHGVPAVEKYGAPTAALTTPTPITPGTPDYAFSAGANGLGSADEMATLTTLVHNNFIRISEIIDCLQTRGLMT